MNVRQEFGIKTQLAGNLNSLINKTFVSRANFKTSMFNFKKHQWQ